MQIPDRLRSLLAPGTRWTVAAIAVVAAGIGALAMGGTVVALEVTSSNEFCSGSCHANNAAAEWKASPHYLNQHGFTAGCSDCHEPSAIVPRLVRKMQAVNEVYGQLTGTIATPEKFQARRLEMSEKEWDRMRKNNSAECRHCHEPAQMQNAQKPYVAGMHKLSGEGGQTCIDCHKGIAHKLLSGVTTVPTGEH